MLGINKVTDDGVVIMFILTLLFQLSEMNHAAPNFCVGSGMFTLWGYMFAQCSISAGQVIEAWSLQAGGIIRLSMQFDVGF